MWFYKYFKGVVSALGVWCWVGFVAGQNVAVKVDCYFPKDSITFSKQIPYANYHETGGVFGHTLCWFHCESDAGIFEFVFKIKVKSLSRTILYNSGGVGEVFDFKTNKWKHEDGTWSHSEMKGKPVDTTVYSVHNLYAFVWVPDRGGMVEKVKFQDFGNEVYWPEFDFANCSVSDENGDGKPEFYLSYMCESDGLDAKPYKQIVYTINQSPASMVFVKSKATAYYPAGNEDDVYRIEYDANWKALPKAVQVKSSDILKRHKKSVSY